MVRLAPRPQTLAPPRLPRPGGGPPPPAAEAVHVACAFSGVGHRVNVFRGPYANPFSAFQRRTATTVVASPAEALARFGPHLVAQPWAGRVAAELRRRRLVDTQPLAESHAVLLAAFVNAADLLAGRRAGRTATSAEVEVAGTDLAAALVARFAGAESVPAIAFAAAASAEALALCPAKGPRR